eukprot:1160252-Pelagomonas_calceolata.AAC.6
MLCRAVLCARLQGLKHRAAGSPCSFNLLDELFAAEPEALQVSWVAGQQLMWRQSICVRMCACKHAHTTHTYTYTRASPCSSASTLLTSQFSCLKALGASLRLLP